jgi:hypothetical protein
MVLCMTAVWRVIVAVLVGGSIVVTVEQRAASQAAPLPSAQQVIARSVAAVGGRAAFKAVRSVHAVGTLAIPAQGISGQFELFSARPAKLVYRLTIEGIGKIENGYDGTIGWAVSPISGPELMTGQQLRETADDAWFDGPLHEAARMRSVDVLGQAEFDGHQAYKLKVVLLSGTEQIEYFDVTSGLQLGSEASRMVAQGVVPTTNFTRNYRKFGEVMQPTTLVQRALGIEQVVTVDTVEYNTDLASVFEPPAEVQALTSK